jgi:hypothetical protein
VATAPLAVFALFFGPPPPKKKIEMNGFLRVLFFYFHKVAPASSFALISHFD